MLSGLLGCNLRLLLQAIFDQIILQCIPVYILKMVPPGKMREDHSNIKFQMIRIPVMTHPT